MVSDATDTTPMQHFSSHIPSIHSVPDVFLTPRFLRNVLALQFLAMIHCARPSVQFPTEGGCRPPSALSYDVSSERPNDLTLLLFFNRGAKPSVEMVFLLSPGSMLRRPMCSSLHIG